MHEFRSDSTRFFEEVSRYATQPLYSWVRKGYLNEVGDSMIEFLVGAVAQETCLVVFKRYLYDSFKGINSFKPWVTGIGRHKASDLIGEFVTKPADLSRAYGEKLQIDYDKLYYETNPENLFIAKEERLILNREINDLNPRQKLITHYYISEVPNQEIAIIMKVTRGNINVTINQIKRILKNRVRQYTE
jgi:RNA polymerase sigma factor (sigma-70 family)